MPRKRFRLEKKVIEVIKKASTEKPDARLSPLEIGERIVSEYRIEAQRKVDESKMGHLTMETLPEQLSREIYAHREKYLERHSQLKADTSVKPMVLYYELEGEQEKENKEKSDSTILDEKSSVAEEEAGHEKDLYSQLQDYMLNFSNCRVFSYHIAHEGSHRDGAGANEWLHPDLVGFQDMRSRVENIATLSLMENLNHKRFIFWSFEVKIKLNKSNIRKSFFQTVANSSWANFAYLVAAEVADNKTYEELKMLSNLHGVGFIKLEKGNPPESRIEIIAKERKEIDWDAFARLAKSNKNFDNNFVKKIYHLLSSSHGKIDLKEWGLKEEVED